MLNIENTFIKIPGVKREYHFLQIADVHIAYAKEDESEEDKAVAQKETKAWSSEGVTPLETWKLMEDYVQEEEKNIDALLIAGDCLDYFSVSNFELLKEKIEALPTEVLYTPGNHELAVFTGNQPRIGQVYHEYYDVVMSGDADFWVRDYGDFLMIGINNADKNITRDQLDQFKEQIARKIPIVLLIHIPIQTEAVLDAIEQTWGFRNMYFIFEANDEASEASKEFSRIVRSAESNVAAILAGHIHAAHEGEFAPGRMQYTAAPLHYKYVRKIIIAP